MAARWTKGLRSTVQLGEVGRLWPAWGVQDGFVELAKYVSREALIRARLDGQRFTAGPVADRRVLDKAIVKGRYEQLRALDIRYALEPRLPPTMMRQQVRDPSWILDTKCGTCLDLSVLYASMCMQSSVAPLLAVGHGHAFVVVRPGVMGEPNWDHGSPGPFAAGGTGDYEALGVQRVSDPASLLELIERGELLAVDCEKVTRRDTTFERACRDGAEHLRRGVVIVDVAWLLEHGGVKALPAATVRPGLTPYMPGGRGKSRDYPSHRPIREELMKLSEGAPDARRDGAETIALTGDPGLGKSTMARVLVAEAPHACGWFLDASSRQALIDSLTAAELAEQNLSLESLADLDREGYAYAALARIAQSDEPVVIALDNANSNPSEIRPLLPRPKAGLVLITTTNSGWRAVAGIETRPLPHLGESDLAYSPNARLLEGLVDGRPLLLEAFQRYLRHSAGAASALIEEARKISGVREELVGPATLWNVVKQSAAPAARRTAELAAFLPPDYLPVALLARLAHAGEESVRSLANFGLLTSADDDSPIVGLHRLFGEVIRGDLATRTTDIGSRAIALSCDEEVVTLLDEHGDRETLDRLAKAIDAALAAGQSAGLGVPLYNLATLLELKGDTKRSAALAERALQYIDQRTANGKVMAAGCLQHRARLINQSRDAELEELEEALSWAAAAQRLLIDAGEERQVGRPQAMEGLLTQKIARKLSDESQLAMHRRARVLLIDSYRRRRALLGDGHPEVARGLFNLAAVSLDLAKLDHDLTSAHLTAADGVYKVVRNRRVEIYKRERHKHIAASWNGRAIVGYERARLLEVEPVKRTAWLRDATDYAVEAMSQRAEFDGPEDLNDSTKTAELLGKIVTFRAMVPGRTASTFQRYATSLRVELEAARMVWNPVIRFDGSTGPREWAQDWVTSDPLAALVRGFGGTPVARDAPLEEAVGRLLEFGERTWDFRKGRERNQVEMMAFSGYVDELVPEAAAALGLNDTKPPALKEAEQVLVLGGLVRACLARAAHTAQFVDSGELRPRRVIALASQRKLNAGEISLLSDLELTDLETEFDAAEAGLRTAFGAHTQTGERRGTTAGGAVWIERDYRREDGLELSVVAVPDSDNGDRATTADGYRWLTEGSSGTRISGPTVIVTTAVYRPYQLLFAHDILSPRISAPIDAIGTDPGAVDPRLRWKPDAAAYLGEVLSTVRAIERAFGGGAKA